MNRNTKRHKLEIMRSQLENERASFIPTYRDLGDFILPNRPRFFTSDVNRGQRRNQKIIDSTATLAVRTLRAGMMSGVTSPARQWKRLTTADPDLAEFGPVKEYLYQVDKRMDHVFSKSNLYNTLPIMHGDNGTFGTAPISVEEDFDSVINTMSFPVGSYMIAKDQRGHVNVFFREFQMTVRNLLAMFGRKVNGEYDWSNFSIHVKHLYDTQMLEAWIDVCHAIYPNEEYDEKKLSSKYKKFASCYYERGGGKGTQSGSYLKSEDEDRYLREKGYDYFPILCPRWEVTGEDVYGTDCPGMTALGDIKQLQQMDKRAAQAIELMVRPPMTGPSILKNTKTSIVPGDMTYSDERDGQKGFRPTFQIDPRIRELEEKQQQVRGRIKTCFYEDLFLMLQNTDRREITAREIDERHEEKLLALGPVLEQLNQDLLSPLIDITYQIMLRQNMLPEAPEELQGKELKIEYISIMQQAQKMIGIGSIERFAGFAQQVITASPSAAVKIDNDQLLDVYADLTSLPPGIVRSDEAVAKIREEEAQAQQAHQQMELMAQGARAAKDLSQSSMEGDTALARVADQARNGQ